MGAARDGQDDSPTDEGGGAMTLLAAGLLSALYEDGSLRYIRYGGVEVLRQIYFALRDRDWRTIPGRIVREEICTDAGGFDVRFDVEHGEGGITFRWTGHIHGSAKRIQFLASGAAGSRLLKNRIGLCVLHPGRACAGQPVRVTHNDGSVEETEFPLLVSPSQPFIEVSALSHEPAPAVEATVTFDGEVFETEDQRNWTDGSFKTYSTPLSAPYPVEVAQGWQVRHRVTCEIREFVTVAPVESKRFAWPDLGTSTGGEGGDPRALGLRHVRVDCRDGDSKPMVDAAARFGLPLEVAILSTKIEDLQSLRNAAVSGGIAVARWIVYKVALQDARGVLGGEVGCGTDANFAELNRNRPDEHCDFAAFSVNPQVHGADERTIIETLDGQSDAVTSALAFAKRVVVSPVTLLPRFNAVATSGGASPADPLADPRQGSEFAAAWTLGSIASLASAGASSITYYEAAGPRGIASTPTASLFAAIAEFAPEYGFPCEVSAPLAVAALGLSNENGRRIVVANLRPDPVDFRLGSDRRTASLGPYAIQWIES